MTIDCEYDQETSQCPVCSKPVTWNWARGLYHGFITEKHNVLMADCVYHSECWDKMERGAEFTALAADRDRLAEQLAAAKARIAELEIGLKAFLHLIKPDADDIESGRTDALSGLPDSHCFELTWAPEEPGSYITAGQIRRAARLLKRNPG